MQEPGATMLRWLAPEREKTGLRVRTSRVSLSSEQTRTTRSHQLYNFVFDSPVTLSGRDNFLKV